MCLFPRMIKNPKFRANKKNGGIVPVCIDKRLEYVPVGCQRCIECRKQKSRAWGIRLKEEIKSDNRGVFVTLTFSNESYAELSKKIDKKLEGYERDNEITTYAMRHFLERWRKHEKTSVKHWFITELGHKGTENVHLHGIIWTDKKEKIVQRWGYGFVYLGYSMNEKTINYCNKYMTKVDFEHREYMPKVLCSKGIGSNYMNRTDSSLNKYKAGKTNETYRDKSGHKLNLPIYYRNKIYTEEEREKLWLEKLNKQERWINGVRHDISTEKGWEIYFRSLAYQQEQNKKLGYGNGNGDWSRKAYENERRNEMHKKRVEAVENKLSDKWENWLKSIEK